MGSGGVEGPGEDKQDGRRGPGTTETRGPSTGEPAPGAPRKTDPGPEKGALSKGAVTSPAIMTPQNGQPVKRHSEESCRKGGALAYDDTVTHNGP